MTKKKTLEINEEWSGMDTIATILVGLFWIVGVLVVLTSSSMPKDKKKKIIGYGTLLAFLFYCFYAFVIY